MAISRSLMNRQLRADGGIMEVTPRENFGLGSSLKKFVRKIIPNEVADIAVKAAPFVAPFNPAIAAAMSGIGTFDQTGSISAGLKSGAMNYGGGQLARYAGGAGFQGNPFTSGAFTPSGFTAGFSSPLGTETGLGKFFSNRGTDPVQGIGTGTTGDASIAEQIAAEGRAVNADSIGLFDEGLTGGNATNALVDASDMALVGDVKQAASQEFNLFKAAADKVQNFDYKEVGNKALELGKKFGKAMFTKPDGKGGTMIDKAAVLGAATFAGSYAEALALANNAGVELTEEEYNEAQRAEKKEEYAGYLTNFFGGQKDGGRINRRFGSPEEGEGSGLMEMLSVEVDAGGDEEEDMLMAYTPGFSSQEKSYLFKKLGGAGGSDRSFTMPQLYRILKNPGDYPEDAAVLKQIAVTGLGKKDGGRIGLKYGTGSSNRVAQLMLERDYLLSKDEDVSFIDLELERDFGIQMKAEGGIMEAKVPTGQMRKNNAGVAERDYRQTGGFVPVGIKERADDVPAMLSKNEFVMTADAVRGIGNGDVEQGSKKLYNTMKQAEQVGKA